MGLGKIEFGFDVEKKGHTPKLIQQVHGAACLESQGAKETPPEADAVFSRKGAEVFVFTADCLPVLFYSTRTPLVAAVHCGWRGALQNIVGATLARLDTPKEDLVAILGPSIHSCHFEVRDDFVEAFRKADLPVDDYLVKNDTTTFRLSDFVAETQLKGIKTIRTAEVCTYCAEPQLPSYRRTGGTDTMVRSWIRRGNS